MQKKIASGFRSCLFIVLLVVASSYGQEQNPPQQIAEDDVVRVSTSLVTVPVSVMDRQGRFIPNLREGQFHIYEDGLEQKIAYFESAEKPFTVALMLDTSDSTRFKLKDIQDAALEFVEQLRPDDRVIVAAFDKNIAVLAEATSDRRVLTTAIRRVNTGGSTGLYNAIDVIINKRLNRIRGRKAIVLFTDVGDVFAGHPARGGTLPLGRLRSACATGTPLALRRWTKADKGSGVSVVACHTSASESVSPGFKPEAAERL